MYGEALKKFRIEITKTDEEDHKVVMVEDENGNYCYANEANLEIEYMNNEIKAYQQSASDIWTLTNSDLRDVEELLHKAKQKIKRLEKKLKEKTLFYKIRHYFKK